MLNISKFFYCKPFDKNSFFLFQICTFVFFFPIIYGGSYYADDAFRSLTGYFGWDVLGRFFARYIAAAYSLNNSFIVDFMPFGYILNMFLIGASAYALYIKLSSKYNIYAYPLTLMFIFNPFLADNLLYRFDSLGMVFSLFFVVLSFSLKTSKEGFLLKVLCLVFSLNFYQTFSNMFIGLVAVETLLLLSSCHGNRKFLKFISFNFLVFVVANFLYFLELRLFGFQSSRGEFLPFDGNLYFSVYKNFVGSFKPFFDFWFKSSDYILVVLPFVLFSLVKMAFNRNYRSLFGVLICFSIVFVSGVGFMALLKNQFLAPRGLSYFPVILMALTTVLMMGGKHFKWIMFFPVFVCFVFVSRVGNMHHIQRDFERPIFLNVTMDLARLKGDGIESIYSLGAVQSSAYLYNIAKVTPFNGFVSRGGWNTTGLLQEYGNKSVKFEWTSTETMNKFNSIKESSKLSIDGSPFYKIYTKDKEGWLIWM
ncbi:glucosyltransferase domain-containing protein [Aeromonas caviae]|uniref:glucosyltransferase domain-containing protein n=1 Tax=Aeromonas caviae TaxID=648 RepID=UPI0022821C10|nr:glucosyltransferase domain-containing protein [Aeromonas caviae]MCY9815742.1 glucosyltransferase domain-containing protein [Aeromonas caviae]